MWFKNLTVFRLKDFNLSADQLAEKIGRFAHRGIGSQDMASLGWVEPHDGNGLVYEQDGQFLLSLRVTKKLLPASVVNQVAAEKARDIEERQGYKPGRKQMKEIKERVTEELLPKAFSIAKDTRVWIDTKNNWFVVDSAVAGRVDEVLGLLAKAIDPFPLAPVYTDIAPCRAMTDWLVNGEVDGSFSIDQDTELSSTSETGAKVRYVRQSVGAEAAQKHIQSGKQCTRLAMTWADRVSFVLDDDMKVRRVAALDVLKENEGNAKEEDDQFSSDFALMTGELARLIADLIEAMGGEKKTLYDV